MTPFKIIVVILLLVIFSALFSGMYYLIKDGGKTDRLAKALTWRIVVSLILFASLLIGAWLGWIEPHGLQ